MKALRLTVSNGPNQGRSLTIASGDSCLVGRGPQADFVVIDLRLSREHFSLDATEGYWRVRDMCSRHGTFVNDQRIEEQFLHQDDVIVAGDTQFLVSLTNAPAEMGEPMSVRHPHFDRRASIRQTWTTRDS